MQKSEIRGIAGKRKLCERRRKFNVKNTHPKEFADNEEFYSKFLEHRYWEKYGSVEI